MWTKIPNLNPYLKPYAGSIGVPPEPPPVSSKRICPPPTVTFADLYIPLLVILLLHKNFWKALIVSYELCKKENAQKAISVLLSVLLGYVSVPVFVIFKVPYE